MSQSANRKASILANLPSGAARIQVRDASGCTRYKEPCDVLDSDTILFKSDGTPITMSGHPGRRPKPPPLMPTTEEAAKAMEKKRSDLSKDPLLGTVKNRPEAAEVLDQVMAGLAEEVASLKFERREAERKGVETSKISMRRVNALKAVGDTWLKRKEQLSAAGVDLDSKAFEVIFTFILETIRSCMSESGVQEEMVDTVFGRLGDQLEKGWKDEARILLKDL